ncbi:MAG: c-type cytochrome [Burkholderiales bacterium]|nr:c-type cytochrome [Burkholderiales bacterium]
MPRLLAILFLLLGPLAATAAEFTDDMAQRTLACTACHGKQGRAGPDGYYPRLAGKPAGYLYNQLLNFRDGRRHYGLMTRLLDPLSDQYLMDIAKYFASLEVPYPGAARTKATTAELKLGARLALKGDAGRKLPACAECHGRALTGVLPDVPGLLGLPRDYLGAQLGAWRTGQRRAYEPDCMGEIARALTREDISAVTAWLSSQPVLHGGKPAAAAARAPSTKCGSAAMPKPAKGGS